MADDCEQAFTCSPIPSVILDPSLLIQKASNSFLHHRKDHTTEWHNSQYSTFLKDGMQISDTDLRHICDSLQEATRTLTIQTSQSFQTGPTEMWQLRVVPIVKDSTLLYLLVEWMAATKRLVENGAISNILATSEAFRVLVEAVNDYAIFLLDTTGRVMTWNTGAELNKGYKPHEIIGKHFSVFYGKEDLKVDKPKMELELCLREGRVEDEGWRYRKDGTCFWANVVISTVYDNGIHVGFAKVTRDLTERRAAESRVLAAYEESANLKSEFLANMSHEIRTPMHGMLSANTLLLDTKLTEEQLDLVTILNDSGRIMLQVVNDILDYSKLASGNFSLALDTIVITSVLNSIIRSFKTIVRPYVDINLSAALDIPQSVEGDSLRYRQIVQNLVSNAVKFTNEGSIRVSAYLQSENDHECTIQTEVHDTGIGVPQSAVDTLFTPFRQFDDSSTKLYQGTGLGLSISKSLVELMGGQIGFMANPKQSGSVFWFTAKFRKTDILAEMTRLTIPDTTKLESSNIPWEDFGQKSVLLAEDNIINQKVMLRILNSLGFSDIDTAIDGTQVIDLVEGRLKSYDIILMDISMPIMNGIVATTQLRSAGVQVPIIAMTANALKGDRERFLAKGMNDYVPKPVDRAFLAKTLTTWLFPNAWI
jgi:osomolarity two-component system sensor histidine kinase TcsA